MPHVTDECSASESRPPSTLMPALASANSGTITRLVHGCSRYCSRSFGEIAPVSDWMAEYASSGVGCSRNDGVSSVERCSSARRWVGARHQPDRQAGDHRVYARLEHREPDPDAE